MMEHYSGKSASFKRKWVSNISTLLMVKIISLYFQWMRNLSDKHRSILHHSFHPQLVTRWELVCICMVMEMLVVHTCHSSSYWCEVQTIHFWSIHSTTRSHFVYTIKVVEENTSSIHFDPIFDPIVSNDHDPTWILQVGFQSSFHWQWFNRKEIHMFVMTRCSSK